MRRALLIFGLLIVTRICGSTAELKYPPLPIGSAAPDFTLPGTDGRTYSLKDFSQAKLLVIIFTCNHCPTAQTYEERIKRLVTDYASRSVAIVAINPNHADAHSNLGVALLQQNDVQGATRHFQTALKLTPNHENARKYLKR